MSTTIYPPAFGNGIDPELELLGNYSLTSGASGFDESANEALKNAPLFTGDAFDVSRPEVFPQRALYGRIISQDCKGFATMKSPKLYINTNAPFSALTCGVQGSGKSHSTSVLLESCLIRDERLGELPEPLSALLFHFDTAAGGGHVQPCEAAYLACLNEKLGGNAKPPKVTVLVMPNSLHVMKEIYAAFPGITVEALHFAPEDINSERLLAMMKVDQEQSMPLYMQCIMDILRTMEHTFDYTYFRQQLSEQPFSQTQRSMLQLRLKFLDSCLQGGSALNRVSKHFAKGHLTIVDLSSPFMDSSSACGLFDIILGLFIETKSDASGKLVVLDEAHKYLTSSGSSSRLTDSILTIIRQQRHLATRVLISTQEPTVVPSKFLDLCSFVIAHRFSSPKWLDYLKQHVSTFDACLSKIFSLKTGEAMIFSPAGVGLLGIPSGKVKQHICAPFGAGYLLVRSRERITRDGGRSILAASSTITLATSTVLSGSSSEMLCETPEDIPPGSIKDLETSAMMDSSTALEECRASSSSMADLSPFTNPPAHTVPTHVFRSRSPDSLAAAEPRFRPLILILSRRRRIAWCDLAFELKKCRPLPYTGKIKKYLQDAAAAKLVQLGRFNSKLCNQWAETYGTST